MIPASPTLVYMDRAPQSWQRELAAANLPLESLLQQLQLPPELLTGINTTDNPFPLRVPPPYLRRIEPENPDDPLLRQILPTITEEDPPPPGYSLDPVGDHDAHCTPGVLQKYHGRALLITTPACAIHCRYCFRRNFPYHDRAITARTIATALEWLRQRPQIQEVILSGGDPLMLPDNRLFELLTTLEQIPHLTTVRLHTRMPVVLPNRVTPRLIQRLQQSRCSIVVVIHCNHPRELDQETSVTLQSLRNHGITLLNQSVLLRGINDDIDTLELLSHSLFSQGVLPYYLHQLDRAVGSHHFEVSRSRAIALQQQLRSRLPGYLLPRLVEEIAGEAGKSPLTRSAGESCDHTQNRRPTTALSPHNSSSLQKSIDPPLDGSN